MTTIAYIIYNIKDKYLQSALRKINLKSLKSLYILRNILTRNFSEDH